METTEAGKCEYCGKELKPNENFEISDDNLQYNFSVCERCYDEHSAYAEIAARAERGERWNDD